MMKVIQDFKPTCFEEIEEKRNWDAAMEEEMVALDADPTWGLVALPHGKKAIG